MHLMPAKTGQKAAPRPTKPKRKGKKTKKRGQAGQNLRLSRSAGFRRPECGGGVCQPGGWLGCTLYAGSVPGAAGKLVDSLVCILFAGRIVLLGPASVCTFFRIASGMDAYFL